MDKPIIVINPRSHQGTAFKRWLSIKQGLIHHLPDGFEEAVIENDKTLDEILGVRIAKSSELIIIVAGGDGSINYLINYLIKYHKSHLQKLAIGGIGLGSSNDFHKPALKIIKGIPLMIDLEKPWVKHDIGVAKYVGENGISLEKYFVINASIGVTAQANWNFNNPSALLKFFKSNSSSLAIFYTAISTILKHKNITVQIEYNDEKFESELSNLNLLKIPFISGNFRYPQSVPSDNGFFGLNFSHHMGTLDLIKLMFDLGKGVFDVDEKKISDYTDRLKVTSKESFVLEFDGETDKCHSVEIEIVPKAINLLAK
ncbi:diacylglycerol kinase family protein [Aquiflexum sp.]|uniref:diacylglycerol/lipid kinase family protein n=1 Tax=Aquiflexum sp. TaxID=1872584 RepID=UPI0035945318